jgi:hypothetical protein
MKCVQRYTHRAPSMNYRFKERAVRQGGLKQAALAVLTQAIEGKSCAAYPCAPKTLAIAVEILRVRP